MHSKGVYSLYRHIERAIEEWAKGAGCSLAASKEYQDRVISRAVRRLIYGPPKPGTKKNKRR